MTLPPAPDRWTIELANAERTDAIAAFGFTERQARFLVNVLLHAGVFVERQYLSFCRHLPRPEDHRLPQDPRRAATRRYFPDKLPIGVQPHAEPHVLTYLVTQPSPMDFRLFLLRHTALLQVLLRWTIRLLVPRQLRKSRLAYLHAAREHLATPLHPSGAEQLEWFFSERKRLAELSAGPADKRYLDLLKVYRSPKFRALYRHWLDDPSNTIRMAGSPLIADNIERGHGTVECVELSRQYLPLSPLVDVA